MYMILDATTALLSLPRFISTKPRSSLITVTKNRFSVSSSEKHLRTTLRRITYGLTHGTRYRTDGPTKSIEVVPRPFAAIDLLAQLVKKNLLHIHDIQVCEINEQLSHNLVDDYNLDFSHGLSNNFAFIVLHNKHLQGVRLYLLRNRPKPTSSGLAIRSTMTNRKFDKTSV